MLPPCALHLSSVVILVLFPRRAMAKKVGYTGNEMHPHRPQHPSQQLGNCGGFGK
jgi:hypothetical protein